MDKGVVIMQEIIAIYARKSRFTGKGESIGNSWGNWRRKLEMYEKIYLLYFSESALDWSKAVVSLLSSEKRIRKSKIK